MRKILMFLFVLVGLTGVVIAQSPISLDDAILRGAQEIQEKLAKGVKVVALNFNSPTEKFSNYVLDEIISHLVNGGKLVVVDRQDQNLLLIQKEMDYQMSGEVSWETQQEAGKKLGAQSIISGSLEDMGRYFRIRFRTIEVVSATRQVDRPYNVRKDNQTNFLLSGASGSAQTSTTRVASPTNNNSNIIDWRNRQAYIGVSAGYGKWYINDYSNDYYGGVLEFKSELCVARFFSFDFDVGLEIGETGWGTVTPCADLLAHIPFRFDSGFDFGFLGGIFAGDPYYFGFAGGGSLGYKLGNGIIFFDALYLIGLFYDEYDYDKVNTGGYIIRMGYKVGIGKRN